MSSNQEPVPTKLQTQPLPKAASESNESLPSLKLDQVREHIDTILSVPGSALSPVRARFAPLNDIGWLRVKGEDRVRWLNGMVTNSIQELAVGQGNYSFVLNAQGRIQADIYAFLLEDCILLETNRVAGLATLLDRFIIMDDVELTVLKSGSSEVASSTEQTRLSDRAGLLLVGPDAAALLSDLGLTSGTPISLVQQRWEDHAVDVVAAHSPLVARFELWADSETIERLSTALEAAGALALDDIAVETLRVLEGTPLYGVDIRDRDLPQETAPANGQSRALHFAKGCYLGQEIVERIRSRGAVHRTFATFELTGPTPGAGASLHIEDPASPAIGELTSVVVLPARTGSRTFALGYIRRAALEQLKAIRYHQVRSLVSPVESAIVGIASPIAAPVRPESSS